MSQELALILERYLEKNLENLVAQVIPILAIDRVIINRVMATTPENLELSIQGIVKNELQAIVNLGGILELIRKQNIQKLIFESLHELMNHKS